MVTTVHAAWRSAALQTHSLRHWTSVGTCAFLWSDAQTYLWLRPLCLGKCQAPSGPENWLLSEQMSVCLRRTGQDSAQLQVPPGTRGTAPGPGAAGSQTSGSLGGALGKRAGQAVKEERRYSFLPSLWNGCYSEWSATRTRALEYLRAAFLSAVSFRARKLQAGETLSSVGVPFQAESMPHFVFDSRQHILCFFSLSFKDGTRFFSLSPEDSARPLQWVRTVFL